jgi:hypothetical protein
MRANSINDDVLISFSDALANNCRLRELELCCGPFQDRVTFKFHAAFTHNFPTTQAS